MIRPYKAEDKDQLIEVFKSNTPKFFAIDEVKDFDNYLSNHSRTYYTVERQNKIIGGTGFYICDKDSSGHITWIFFHPDSTGHGLGKEAVQHCLKILKSNSHIEKLVVRTSQLAFGFFEKFGYELVQIDKDYWAPGLDLYLMEQQL